MKSETYRSFNESCCTFEAREPLALALSILAYQLDEDIAESGGGGDMGSGHGHVIGNHFLLWEDPATAMKKGIKSQNISAKEFIFICKMKKRTCTSDS